MICDRSLHFPGIETYRQRINEAIDESNGGEKLTVIADMERVIEVDYTSLKVNYILLTERSHNHTQTKALSTKVKVSFSSAISRARSRFTFPAESSGKKSLYVPS